MLFVAKAAAVGFIAASGEAMAVGAAVGSAGVNVGQVAALVGAIAALISAVTAAAISLRRPKPDPLAEALAKRLLANEDGMEDEMRQLTERSRPKRRRRS